MAKATELRSRNAATTAASYRDRLPPPLRVVDRRRFLELSVAAASYRSQSPQPLTNLDSRRLLQISIDAVSYRSIAAVFSSCRSPLPQMKAGSMSRGAVRKETKEVLKPVDDSKVGKRKAAPKANKSRGVLEVFQEEIPNVKGVSTVGKTGGEKWRSLTEAFYDLIDIFELNGFPSEDNA
ncbi:hypothetical protein BUALT_Bualt08G0061800 [Buddleja alternifolia]|uniref:Uncharacterized protein n=1 Tax=Buddleja alternifolia TaxID=168488 RepID=A0AAV6XCM3_9LAMI|nr:hypothetical protein BUALT_Bualt08G0061800 [Buddleja alternifolia]